MIKTFLHNSFAVLRVLIARLRFLAVFLVAALAVGYWDNIRNHWDKWTRPAIAPDSLAATPASDIEYYCAMHPTIVRSEPGNCPICSMPLVKRKKGQAAQLPADVLARVQLSPQRIALAGIATSAVEPRELVREIHALGVLDYNETKVAQLSARVAGRADQLFIQYTGQEVRQNDPVYSLYSPELYAAQREYLLARQRVNQLPADAAPEVRSDASAVYNATMEKLVLWGVTREQLDKMDREFDQSATVPSHLVITSPISGIVVRKDIFEGSYVNVGDRPYTIADLSTLWLQAKIYERDVPLVQIGQEVDVTVDAMPNQVFKGTVTFRAFQLDPQTRTLDARIEVRNPGLRLRPGMFADAVIRVPVVAEQPDAASTAATQPVLSSRDRAATFQSALAPYLKAETLLAQDKPADVLELLKETASRLAPLAGDPAIGPAAARLTDSLANVKAGDLKSLRAAFKPFSAALIEIGKSTGLPPDNGVVQVFRCPMAKANWLQATAEVANPFYGAEMLTCGGPVETLPKASDKPAPVARLNLAAGKVLSVPRSAVIDTGRRKIVYVESSPGVYDMREVKLGPLAGDYYPVLDGLDEMERVVTAGAFLVDAENRLNPSAAAEPRGDDVPATQPTADSQVAPAAAPMSSMSSMSHQH